MVSVNKTGIERQEKRAKAASGSTGIPGAVQAKFEAASGLSFDDVRVHYNSSRPAQLGAYAYTQGSQVYIGPGQERHLEHELGHVIQQKRGLVKADGYIGGVPVNRDPGLERAADLGASQPVQGFWKSSDETVQMMPGGSGQGTNTSWYNQDGSINYPPNDGAVPGTEQTVTLAPGTRLGRYGHYGQYSCFVTEAGAPADTLALPPGTDPSIYQEFEVKRDINGAVKATIADWGGSRGGGTQYKLPSPIRQLIAAGDIEPV